MTLYYKFALIAFSFIFVLQNITAQDISLIHTSFIQAQNDEERYYSLYNVYLTAIEKGVNIDYSGIKDIYLSIPPNATPIPLTSFNDFRGVVFHVYNNSIDNFPLFIKQNPVKIKDNISGGRFHEVLKDIQSDKNLVIVSDKTPWIYNRRGFNYSEIRKDIFLSNNKRIRGAPIATYDFSNAELCLSKIDNGTTVKNIRFERDSLSTQKTLLMHIENIYNLRVENIEVVTPDNEKLYEDAIITIRNGVKVLLNNINVRGTYSFVEKYGYAFSLNNIRDLIVNRVNASGRWGVFCCYNINGAVVKNSVINRFDLHCYGRDFKFVNCTFTKTGLPLSSMYGFVEFKKCTFQEAISIIYRADYNAYTPFDLKYVRCEFILSPHRNYMIDLVSIPVQENDRKELRERNLPNIVVKKCSYHFASPISNFYIIKGDVGHNCVFGNIKNISLDNLVFDNLGDLNLYLSENKLKTQYRIKVRNNNLIVDNHMGYLRVMSNMDMIK